MNYINSIRSSILIFPLVAFLFTIPFILYQYHKYGSINKFRVFIVYSFILYMLTIYFLVILPLPKREDVVNNNNMIRLTPFAFIHDFKEESSLVINNPKTYIKAIKEPCFYVVIFNILMTIPFGMYLRYYFKCNIKKVIILGFLLSLFFELTQLTGLYFIYPKPYRLFDIDDLFLNTLGAILGYLVMGAVNNFLPTRDKIDEESKNIGKKVSGFRRFTIFNLDLFIYLVILIFGNIFFDMKILKYLVFMIYYLIIPILTKGYTIGSLFLKVKIEYDNNFTIKTILRNIFVFIYYFPFPYIIKIAKFNILIYLLLVLVIFLLFYPINFIILIKKKQMPYDKLFKCKYISTIK